jgi:hypothetical protein
VLLALLLSLAPLPQVEQLNAEGLELFEKKQYEQGIAVFEQAYALSPLPGFLYNMALGNRLLGRCAESADLYRRYLAAEPKAPNRKKVETRLDEMERCAKDQPRPPPEPQAPPPDEAPAAMEVAPLPPPPPTPPPAVVADEPAKKSGPLRWVALGLGLAAGGTSAVLLISAKGDFDRLNATCAPACMRADWQGGRTKELVGWALVGTAAVAVAAAIVLWIAGL